MPYTLRDDVYFCVADGRLAFLDTRNDRYFCLPHQSEAAFRSWLADRLSPDSNPEAFSSLLSSGVLVQSDIDDKDYMAPAIAPATRSALDFELCKPMPFSVLEAALDRRRAANTLRLQGFHVSLSILRRRRKLDGKSAHDVEASLLPGASAFRAARKLVASHDQCLPRSLALMNFYARRQIFPKLVIGVGMTPFRAHAWVQHDDLVLNDGLDRVQCYTPILVI
jgi:hypothetical protein